MSGRSWAVLGVAGATLVVCGLAALTVYGSYRAVRQAGARLRFLEPAGTWATARETKSYPAGPEPELAILSAAGGITVTAGAADRIEVEMVKTAWGRDAAAARAALPSLLVTESRRGAALTLDYRAPDTLIDLGDGGGTDRVGFNVKVPPATRVRLESGAGDVNVSGVEGGLDLRSRFGETALEDLGGPVRVEVAFGPLSARGLAAGAAAVDLSTRFGPLLAEDIGGGSIRLSNQNGPLEGRRLTATGALRAENRFGPLDLAQLSAASLLAEVHNGGLRLAGGQVAGELAASSRFGGLEVIDVRAGRYRLATANGDLGLTRPVGPLVLRADFGDIQVRGGREAVLDVKGANGDVDIAAALAPGKAQAVTNRFGDVTLAIPADSRLDLRLATRFGEVHTELPVTVRGQASDAELAGTLNGGGPTLTMETANGDLRLTGLASGGDDR